MLGRTLARPGICADGQPEVESERKERLLKSVAGSRRSGEAEKRRRERGGGIFDEA